MKLWAYTRKPIDNVYYDPRLAFSMHLALETKTGLIPLNHNSGVLFAKGTENEDGSINPKTIMYPCLYKAKNGYKIFALRKGGDGEEEPESNEKCIEFTTLDFVHFKETGLIEIPNNYKKELQKLKNSNRNNDLKYDLPEGALFWSSIKISEDEATYLAKKL
ncbi:MAG: hypothetical protein HUK25_01115, partial [Treponema sp.]|nr:hypothetical protein [Treponema sp.]